MNTNLDEIRDPKYPWRISLSALTGVRPVDISVMVNDPFGDPLMEISEIHFENGESISVGGEHDCAYFEFYHDQLGITQEILEKLRDETDD